MAASEDRAEYRRNIGPQALGRILYVVGGAAVFVAATHVMPIEDVGNFSFALIFLTIVWHLSDLGTTAPLGTLLGKAEEELRGAILGQFIVFRLLLSLLVGCGAIVLALLTAPAEVRQSLVFACALTPLVASRFFEPVFQVCQRPELSVTLGISYLVVLVLTAGPALMLAPDRPGLLVVSHVLAGAAYAVAGYIAIARLVRIEFKLTANAARDMLGIVGPVTLFSLFGTMNLRVGALILSSVIGPSALATYYAAQRFLEVGGAIAATAITPVFSMAGRRAREAGTSTGTGRAMVVAIALSLPIAVLSLPLSGPVIRLLYGSELYASATLLPFMAIQFMVFCVALATMPVVLTSNRPGILIWSAAAAFAVNVATCFALIPSIGALGATLAALLAETTLTSVLVAFLVLTRDRSLLPPACLAAAAALATFAVAWMV